MGADHYTGPAFKTKVNFIAVGKITNVVNKAGEPGQWAVFFFRCLWVVHRRTHFKTHWLSVADKSKYSLMLWIRNSRIAIFCPKNVKIYRRRRRLTDGGNLTSGDFLFESEKKWFMSFQLKPKWKIPLFSSTRTRRTGFAIFLSWLANARQSVSQSQEILKNTFLRSVRSRPTIIHGCNWVEGMA